MLSLQPGHHRFANPDVYTSAKEKKSSRLYFRQRGLDGVSTTGSQPDGALSKRDRGTWIADFRLRISDCEVVISELGSLVAIRYKPYAIRGYVPSDIFQKVDGVALVSVSQFVDVGKAWETGFSPHAESSLVRGCGLGKKVIDDGLGDALLIADTNSWNVSLTNKCTHAVP
jgi:hypothetical protein